MNIERQLQLEAQRIGKHQACWSPRTVWRAARGRWNSLFPHDRPSYRLPRRLEERLLERARLLEVVADELEHQRESDDDLYEIDYEGPP